MSLKPVWPGFYSKSLPRKQTKPKPNTVPSMSCGIVGEPPCPPCLSWGLNPGLVHATECSTAKSYPKFLVIAFSIFH